MMKQFTAELTPHMIFVLLYIQSAWINQVTSASVINTKTSVPVAPLNELSGPALKFRPVQQAVQDQQSKIEQFARVNFDQPIKQSDSSIKPGVIKDVCDRYDVDGCSIPFHLPFFFKHLFTPSCDRHDICYHCGVGRRITRIKCDQTFRDNMRKACKTTDYENKPWRSRYSYKSDAETKEHRITMQQIIEDKTEFLTDIMENMTHEIKKYISDTIRLLRSPGKLKLLRENVLLTWALLLSEFMIREPGESDATFKSKSEENERNDNKKHFLLKRQSWAYYHNHSFELSDAVKHLIQRNDAEKTSAGTSEHDLSLEILEVADDISMRYQHYRTSDVLDSEDIDRLECLYTANIYFIAVRLFGYSSYWKHAEYYCNEGFVNGCLPQS